MADLHARPRLPVAAPAAAISSLAADLRATDRPGMFSEAFAGADGDVAAIGFVLALCRLAGQLDGKPILWVQDRLGVRETGRPYLPGLTSGFAVLSPILHVEAATVTEVLWSMEEGLRCRALGAVIGELHGAPKALDFTASRRLALRAEVAGLPAYLIRFAGQAGLSAARTRWRITALPSQPPAGAPKRPGPQRWAVERFRAPNHDTGQGEAVYDRTAHRLDLAGGFRAGPLAPPPAGSDRG